MRVFHTGANELCLSKVGAIESGARKIGTLKVCFTQVSSPERLHLEHIVGTKVTLTAPSEEPGGTGGCDPIVSSRSSERSVAGSLDCGTRATMETAVVNRQAVIQTSPNQMR
jgi:hypothetical protein